jgi:DNA-binding SARP family transcriptional activator/nucleoid-associated protein YgaU
LAALVIGVPVALIAFVGWPLPRRWPDWSAVAQTLSGDELPDAVVLKTLAVFVWLGWAQFAAGVAAEARAVLRGRTARRVPLTGAAQPIARVLVAATLLSLAGRPVAGAAPARPSLGDAVAVVAPAPSPSTPARATAPTVVVGPGDTLWGITARHLGDGRRYPEVFEANAGRLQRDGHRLSDPDVIRPGWSFTLPAPAPADEPDPVTRAGSDPPAPAPASNPPTTAPSHAVSPDAAGHSGPAVGGDGQDATDDELRGGLPLGVPLPSGSLVAGSLATGAAAALALARLRRRHHRLPGTPAPGIAYQAPPGEALAARLAALARRADPDACDDAQEQFLSDEPCGSSTAALPVGERAGSPLTLDPVAAGLLTVRGPGAPDALRAMVATALLGARRNRPHVLATGTVWETLFPGVAPVDGVRVITDPAEALAYLWAELLGRARRIELAGADDFASYPHDDEDLPVLLVLTDDPGAPGWPPRGTGAASGTAAVALDRAGQSGTEGAYLDIGEDGTITSASPGHLAGGRAYRLRADEAADLFGATAAALDDVAPEAAAPAEAEPAERFDPPQAADAPLVAVRMFGRYTIRVGGQEPLRGLRERAKEFLALLLLHPEGVSLGGAVEAMWPDADAQRGQGRLNTARGNLRAVVRDLAGDPGLAVVERVGGDRYRVQVGLFDVDLWRFQRALEDVRRAVDENAALAALTEAADAVTGELLPGVYYEWVEPAREDLRRRAVDALARLADLRHERGDLSGAAEALDQGVGIDPYAEELYRRLMSLDAARGLDPRRVFRRLQDRLGEIDVDPDPATLRLLADLATAAPVPASPPPAMATAALAASATPGEKDGATPTRGGGTHA